MCSCVGTGFASQSLNLFHNRVNLWNAVCAFVSSNLYVQGGLDCLFGLLESFGCGEEDKLCFDLFTRVCFSWLRSFCRRDVVSFPRCINLQPVRRSVELRLKHLIGFKFSLYQTLFSFEITPLDVCFILKLLLVSSQRAIRRMLNRNCCLRLCCLLP